jgi:hypothetical protein
VDLPHFVCLFLTWWTFGLFPSFALGNKATVNTGIQIFECLFSILLGHYLGVELMGFVENLWLTLVRHQPVFQTAVPFYILISNVQGFQFLHILTSTNIVQFLIHPHHLHSHQNRCEETCDLTQISLMTNVDLFVITGTSLHVLVGCLCKFFGKMAIRVLCPFLK